MDNQYKKLKFLGLKPLVYKPSYNSDIYEIFTIVDTENYRVSIFGFKNKKEIKIKFKEKLNNINGLNNSGIEYEILGGYNKTIKIIFNGLFYSRKYRVEFYDKNFNSFGCSIENYGG